MIHENFSIKLTVFYKIYANTVLKKFVVVAEIHFQYDYKIFSNLKNRQHSETVPPTD